MTVADQKVTALSLMEAMRQRKQWMLQLSDDVFASSIEAAKIMFCENNLTLGSRPFTECTSTARLSSATRT